MIRAIVRWAECWIFAISQTGRLGWCHALHQHLTLTEPHGTNTTSQARWLQPQPQWAVAGKCVADLVIIAKLTSNPRPAQPSPAETHFSWDKEKTYKPISSEKNYCGETKEILGVVSSSFNKELRVPLPASHLQSSVPSLVIFSGIWRQPSSIVIVNVFAFK